MSKKRARKLGNFLARIFLDDRTFESSLAFALEGSFQNVVVKSTGHRTMRGILIKRAEIDAMHRRTDGSQQKEINQPQEKDRNPNGRVNCRE